MKKIITVLLLALLLISCNSKEENKTPTPQNNTEDNIENEKSKKQMDSLRIRELSVIQTSIELYYAYTAEYPSKETFKEDISDYITQFPIDPKDGETINGCTFGYTYEVSDDEYGIKNSKYRLSTCLESKENIENKAKNDGGIYDNKYEKFN